MCEDIECLFEESLNLCEFVGSQRHICTGNEGVFDEQNFFGNIRMLQNDMTHIHYVMFVLYMMMCTE